MKTVTLTAEQAQLVLQCLDIATKAGGLQTAVQVLPIAQEIERQLTAHEE